MKTVIANRGVEKQGKTTSIKKVYAELKQKYPQLIIHSELDNGDVKAIVEIGGIKIGIESQGDPYSRQGQSLQDFLAAGCEIILVACRTKGDTMTNVLNLGKKNEYRIIFAQNYVNFELKEALNYTYAICVLNMIDDIINNKL